MLCFARNDVSITFGFDEVLGPAGRPGTLPPGLLLDIICVAAGVFGQRAVFQLDDAVHHPIQEIAVVRDHQHRTLELVQGILKVAAEFARILDQRVFDPDGSVHKEAT